MVTLTRLDCVLSSAGLMRFTLANALRHTRHRTVFQRKLIDQPLMANVLADLALDAEAATALAFRLAGSFDRARDPQEAAYPPADDAGHQILGMQGRAALRL